MWILQIGLTENRALHSIPPFIIVIRSKIAMDLRQLPVLKNKPEIIYPHDIPIIHKINGFL